MTTLQDKLNSYGDGYWDFQKEKRAGVHEIATYPAMMVAPMQHKIIGDIIKLEKNIDNIFDPFHGSGTTLVEGKKFNLNLIGIDINPLANIITTVKINGVNTDTIYNSIEDLIYNFRKLKNDITACHYFPKISKWFREDVISDLTVIRQAIILEKNRKNRLYFWVCLSDLIRKYSNTRSSTFKLHIKEEEKIISMENNVFNDFIILIKEKHLHLDSNYEKKQSITQGDSNIEMEKMKSNSVDLICTSPPYGDNGTTVTYGQYSILSLLWMDRQDISVNNEELISNFSAIDSQSLGGRLKNSKVREEIPALEEILTKISNQKKKKVNSFFSDYFLSLSHMIRILKPNSLMVLTLGNRRVDNVEIRLDKITSDYCELKGLKVEATFNRAIPRKRMPRKISNIKSHGAVSSMNNETVLILRKGEN
ncbi:DNA methyltransferase [Jeotgalibacillus terrae]|uniref:DNA methyltransferase n=1 Tax=Jeotgalibacillus terrae TaxID=587735 RepID=A0ABW5ZLC6_9BACL|nr:DNA methyltransferase [Jeotgalibacillus terrae]MBM7580908.1 site-specific DNA-methyltransferase (cytosine-N4-specific) [Jeotgalibacillus terrae]